MLASNHEVISCYSADNHISVLDSMNETEFQILFQLSKFVSIQHFFFQIQQICVQLNKGQVPGPLCQTAALQTNET